MAKSEKKSSPSLYALIEQTARMLRQASKAAPKKRRSFSKKTDLTSKNKIGQIAALLRSVAKRASDK